MEEPTEDILNGGEHPLLDAHARRRGLLFLALASALVGIALAIQSGLKENFLVEEIGVTAFQRGFIEAARELCGILALGVLAILAGFAEPMVAIAMLMVTAVGFSGYFFAGYGEFTFLVIMSMIWSQGLHVWMPLPNSMAIALSEPGRVGYRMGQVRGAGAAGFAVGLVLALMLMVDRILVHTHYFLAGGGAGLVLGLLAAWVLLRTRYPLHWRLLPFCAGGGLGLGVAVTGLLMIRLTGMRPMYLIGAAVIVVGALFYLGVPRNIKTPGPRLVFRRKYYLYYALSFFEGWRKQIFMCFAGFLLVKDHKTELTTILLLRISVQAAGYFAFPLVGKIIDHLRERTILIFYYGCLTFFFIGYAFIPDKRVLYALFIVDNAFFVFAMSIETYVGRIAPKSELTPTLSMGVAVNHVAAVIMPLAGGILWYAFGHQYAFLLGAFAAAVSVAVVAVWMPKKLAPPSDTPSAEADN